ncbi:MAG: dockerin type I domain-containing protein [Candidatus Omnitrophota bacterium]
MRIGKFGFLIGLFASASWAGGPLSVYNGSPVTWKPNGKTLLYQVDQGAMGPLSNYQAINLIQTAFQKWSRVDTSTLAFDKAKDVLSEDVTSKNYNRIVNSLPSDANPIIFDDDGSIIDLLMGSGSKTNILGLTSTSINNSDIVKAQIVFNGYYFEREHYSQTKIQATFLHEVGHVFGLDHSQYSRHLAQDGIGSNDGTISVLYPTTTDDDSQRQELSFDDKIAVSNLYPTIYHKNSTGSIRGTVKRGSTELPGVNIIARDANDPVSRIATTVSGTYNNRGAYEIAGLPPGKYEVMAEAVDSYFKGTSSVGQHAEQSNSPSFRNPIKAQYYSSGGAARSAETIVEVKSLNYTSGIDISVEQASLPSDENYTYLMGLNSKTVGGAKAGYYAPYKFLLAPSGSEGSVNIVFDFDQNSKYTIDIARELSNGGFKTFTVKDTALQKIVTLSQQGDVPLEKTRYFISIGNRGSYDFTFTISSRIATPIPSTPTPQPTNTPTPTLTPSLTPSSTRTPTSTPKPTFTRTPTHTPISVSTPTAVYTPTPTSTPTASVTPTPTDAPTPAPLCGDVNGDGKIGIEDVIYILRLSIDLPVEVPPGVTMEEMRWTADVNGDGKIMANDAILIYRKIADPNLNLGCR